jgi:hypothetical protein
MLGTKRNQISGLDADNSVNPNNIITTDQLPMVVAILQKTLTKLEFSR